MSYLNDRVLDNGLTVLDTEATTLHICSAEHTVFATLNSLGNKTLAAGDITLAARSPSGRKAVVAALSAGSVTGNGTATSYAIVDTANSRLLAAGSLSASQAVTSGNTFSLASFDIGIPGPA
jgi:hypothetical protein